MVVLEIDETGLTARSGGPKTNEHSLLGLGFRRSSRLRSRLPPPFRQLTLIPSLHPEQVREEVSQDNLQRPVQQKEYEGNGVVTHIQRNECTEDPDVSPPVRVFNIERKVQKLVRVPE